MPYKREDRSRSDIIICVLDAVRARLSEYILPLHTLRRIDNPTIDDKYKQMRRSIRTNNFKYIESASLKEFFDLRKNPLEFNNQYSTLDNGTKKKLHLKLERAFKSHSIIKRS